MQPVPQAMDMASRIIPWLQEHWRDPDDGIWEVRGPRRHFVHSKVMAWVAADRMAKMAEATGIEAKPLAQMRDDIHEEVCREASTPIGTRSRSTTDRNSSTPRSC